MVCDKIYDTFVTVYRLYYGPSALLSSETHRTIPPGSLPETRTGSVTSSTIHMVSYKRDSKDGSEDSHLDLETHNGSILFIRSGSYTGPEETTHGQRR